jgi:hypothetical protein
MPISVDKRVSRRYRRRLLLAIMGSLVCVGAAAYYYSSLVAERRLQMAKAEADRLDPGWRLDEIVRNQPTFPDAENGALQRLAVQRMLPPNSGSSQMSFALSNVRPEEQLDAELIARLRAKMGQLSSVVAAARKLDGARSGTEPIIWTGKEYVPAPAPFMALQVARLLSWDAFLLAQDHDMAAAAKSCRPCSTSAARWETSRFCRTDLCGWRSTPLRRERWSAS